jgi:hypothetical protein
MKTHGIIHNFELIAGVVNETGDKLFTGANDTGEIAGQLAGEAGQRAEEGGQPAGEAGQ